MERSDAYRKDTKIVMKINKYAALGAAYFICHSKLASPFKDEAPEGRMREVYGTIFRCNDTIDE